MSNWDRVFGGTNEVSESDIASAQRRSNGNYARILDKQVRSDPLYRGTKPDALTRLALRNLELARVAEQSKTTPTGLPYGVTPRPSGVPSDAPRMYAGELTKSAPPELVGNALLAGNLGGLSAAFGALAPLRAGLAVGAGADAVLGAKAGEGDTPAVLSGAGMLGRRALPVALATGAAYAADAEAGSKYDPRAFLRYIQQNFPDMFDSAKQGMKFTADTGREAGVYGLLDDSMRIKPRMIIHGSTNSVPMPRDLRRELVDSANAFDMHTHPNDNALPSTPLNNASQNALGGDTQYYQSTGRGVPWKRPGRADNFIVSVQPRAIREPLDFGNGRGESWIHMKMGKYPGKEELTDIRTYLEKNADRYEGILPADLVDMGMMLPDDAGTFALLKHYADTGRGDFTYNLGKEVFGPGGRDPATPMYEAIYDQLRKDKQLRNYAGGGLVKSGLKMMFPNLGAPLHVVKPKGGNWLSGSVEDALKGLKKDEPNSDATWAALPRDLIDKYRHSSGPHQLVQKTHPKEWAAAQQSLQPPINNWIEGPLTKYVKTRMASPDDEVRRLAEEGVLHANNLPDVRPNHLDILKGIRERGGFPREGNSRWEDIADWHAWPTPVESVRRGWFKEPAEARRVTEGSKEWLDKVAPETPIYGYTSGIRSLAEDLGFPHLIDELSNALDAGKFQANMEKNAAKLRASGVPEEEIAAMMGTPGLPRHLQLTPEAVKNLSMEKAVRRVADINAWRAAQKVEANRKLAEQASIVREYAENNPKGLRWVELKAPENLTPEQQKYYDKLISVQTDPQVAMGAARKYGTNPLADQLKYEGDTMGHCVGGYCDDVLSGRSRIFSLRDAKGEPHVTVEVDPSSNIKDHAKGILDPENPEQTMHERIMNERMGNGDYEPFAKQLYDRLGLTAPPPKIVQIKGKQNRKPNDEYLPFVQDFVKNSPHGQPWSDVGDLQNTGLRRTIDVFNSNELKKIQEAGIEVPTHATPEEIEAINRQIWPDPDVRAGAHPEGFASGGSVGVPAAGWELLTDPTGSPEENKLSWDIFSGHNDAEQLEALE